MRVKGRTQAVAAGKPDVCVFHEVAVQPLSILGLDTSAFLPEVCVPLPAELQDKHRLQTSVADGSLRIVHSSDGFVYVFERRP